MYRVPDHPVGIGQHEHLGTQDSFGRIEYPARLRSADANGSRRRGDPFNDLFEIAVHKPPRGCPGNDFQVGKCGARPNEIGHGEGRPFAKSLPVFGLDKAVTPGEFAGANAPGGPYFWLGDCAVKQFLMATVIDPQVEPILTESLIHGQRPALPHGFQPFSAIPAPLFQSKSVWPQAPQS